MRARNAAILALLTGLAACHLKRPDHTDPKGLPPPAREELSWESFFKTPWRDPLHDKYEELFDASFPNRPRHHFAVDRPFSDVNKYQLAFDKSVAGARGETESGGGEHTVSMRLPESAGKPVGVKTDESSITLSVSRRAPARRYRSYRPEELVIPLPDGADPQTARVVRDGDWVRIKFNSRSPGGPHGK